MRRKPLLLTAALAALTFVGVSGAVAADDEIGPMHSITCYWVDSVNPPYSSTSTAVAGYVQVRCSDRLDAANTSAQLQRYSNSAWRAHGDPVVSYSTGGYSSGEYLIHVNDSAGKTVGGWYYRTMGTHFGQHGNTFALPNFYSNSRYLTRN